MLGGYIEFFMDPTLADCYIKLKEELEMLLQKKVIFQDLIAFSMLLFLVMNHFISG